MSGPGEFYTRLDRHKMSEAKLFSYGYPRSGNSPGKARVSTHLDTFWKVIPGPKKRECDRCEKIYEVDAEGWPVVNEECKWHLKRANNSVHPCCYRTINGRPCQTSPYHIHCNIDPDNLTGFIHTSNSTVQDKSVFSLDTEMVATTCGYEVAAITVVDHRAQVVYETKVMPKGRILNYNTPFSGLAAEDLRGVTTTLKEVQAKLLSLLGPLTILVGHGMHGDLLYLQILHDRVVDTVHLYPHPKGWPVRNSLGFLKERHLPTLSAPGLKCREDAVACMMLARLKCGLRGRP